MPEVLPKTSAASPFFVKVIFSCLFRLNKINLNVFTWEILQNLNCDFAGLYTSGENAY